MPYNLTESQKDLVRWMVQENRDGNLPDEFSVVWLMGSRGRIMQYSGDHPELTQGALDALDTDGLVMSDVTYETKISMYGSSKRPKARERKSERSRRCRLTALAFDAIDSNFDAPDTSFVTQLTPLADVTDLDEELADRCLVILGAGGANPKVWDSAVRTAVVVLEERLRDVGGISDESRIGQALVNDVLSGRGTLASKFSSDPERQGYRDMFAGVVGVFRNRYAHRLVDPTPEDAGAFIVFVNLLLKSLEDLRQPATT